MSDQIGRESDFSDSTIELKEIAQSLAALFCDLIAWQVNRMNRFIFLESNAQWHKVVVLES